MERINTELKTKNILNPYSLKFMDYRLESIYENNFNDNVIHIYNLLA